MINMYREFKEVVIYAECIKAVVVANVTLDEDCVYIDVIEVNDDDSIDPRLNDNQSLIDEFYEAVNNIMAQEEYNL